MALLKVVGGDAGVEVVDVVVLDCAGRVFEPEGDRQIGAALQGCSLEGPFVLVGAVWRVDGVFHVEDDSPEDLSEVVGKPEFVGRDAEPGQDPSPEEDGEDLLEEGPAEHSIALADDIEKSEEPNKGYGDEEVDDGFSEYSCNYLLDSLHLVILLFGEDNGL